MSSLHICTLEQEKITQGDVIAPRVSFYPRGNLASVRRAFIVKRCEMCGKPFRTPLWCESRHTACMMCRRKQKAEERGEEYQEPKRGEITFFSDGSRRRLMRTLATIDKDIRPHFVTLTYPDSAYTSHHNNPERWKLDLRAFLARFHRRFPDASLIWRLEAVDRKSGEHIGEYMPHFHCLVFGVEYNRLRLFVPDAWYQVVKSGDEKHLKAGTQVSKVLSRRGIFRYASKTIGARMSAELGKDIQVQAGEKVGRYYGIAFRENFSHLIAEIKEIVLDGELGEKEAIRIIRAFRRLSRLSGRALSALTAFCDGSWLSQNIMKLLEPVLAVGSYRATGRRYDEPFSEYVGWLIPQVE